MTEEQAIKIRSCFANGVEFKKLHTGETNILADELNNAIEKQIPKKPIDICTPVVTWGLCPNCKGELNKLGGRKNRVFKTNAYCPDCGQALDWSDTQ